MCIAWVNREDLHLFSMSNDSNETNLVGSRRGVQAISYGSLWVETHPVEQPSRAEFELVTSSFIAFVSVLCSLCSVPMESVWEKSPPRRGKLEPFDFWTSLCHLKPGWDGVWSGRIRNFITTVRMGTILKGGWLGIYLSFRLSFDNCELSLLFSRKTHLSSFFGRWL